MPAHWFGQTYPTLPELENLAIKLGAPVFYERTRQPFLQWDRKGPLCIIVPQYKGTLARSWAIAHELGHLVLEHGPLGDHLEDPREIEADDWASCALIPAARVQAYKRPSAKGFVNALNKNIQQVTPGIESLAWRIAFTRLRALEEAV